MSRQTSAQTCCPIALILPSYAQRPTASAICLPEPALTLVIA